MRDRRAARLVTSFAAGVLFALGLVVSGMVRPEKVLGFLDIGGRWDPSLMLVMAAAVPVHALAWWILRRRRTPLLGGDAPPAPSTTLDARLMGGAALFGIGWGTVGICPGPGVVNVAAGAGAFVFVPAMLVGVALSRLVVRD